MREAVLRARAGHEDRRAAAPAWPAAVATAATSAARQLWVPPRGVAASDGRLRGAACADAPRRLLDQHRRCCEPIVRLKLAERVPRRYHGGVPAFSVSDWGMQLLLGCILWFRVSNAIGWLVKAVQHLEAGSKIHRSISQPHEPSAQVTARQSSGMVMRLHWFHAHK